MWKNQSLYFGLIDDKICWSDKEQPVKYNIFSCFSPQIPFWSPEEIIYSIHPPSPEKSEKSEELSVGSDTPSYVKRRGQLASLSQLHSLGDRRDSATPHSAPIRLSTGATSPNNFLRTPTLSGKWQWKSVEKGDASPSGYKIKSCIFCNFRENSLKSPGFRISYLNLMIFVWKIYLVN